MSARGTVERRSNAIQTRHRPLPSSAFQPTAEKGLADGYARLDSSSLVPSDQLASGVATAAKALLGDRTWGDIATQAELDALIASLGALAFLSAVTSTQIADGAVTYFKIQDLSATNKLLGRASGGPGVVEEITLTAAGRALIDDATASDQRTTLGLGSLATLNKASGSWTPTDQSGGGLSLTTTECDYVQHDKITLLHFAITYPGNADPNGTLIGGIPQCKATAGASVFGGFGTLVNQGTPVTLLITQNTQNFSIRDFSNNNLTNAQMSGKVIRGTLIYEAA